MKIRKQLLKLYCGAHGIKHDKSFWKVKRLCVTNDMEMSIPLYWTKMINCKSQIVEILTFFFKIVASDIDFDDSVISAGNALHNNNNNNNNGPNGHLFYVGGDLMMRRGMLPTCKHKSTPALRNFNDELDFRSVTGHVCEWCIIEISGDFIKLSVIWSNFLRIACFKPSKWLEPPQTARALRTISLISGRGGYGLGPVSI